MYRLRGILLCILSVLVLAACGGGSGGELVSKGNPDQPVDPEVPPTPEQPPTPEPPPVEPPVEPTYSATLSWEIPDTRVNGEDLLLSEIGGYEIVYKRSIDSRYSILTVDDHTRTQMTIEDLPSGSYEFMIAAFDSDGIYSDYSDPTRADIGG